MKQHITPKQALSLGDKEFYRLFNDLVKRDDWANYHHKKITIGKLIETLKEYYQLKIYTFDDYWHVQFFELDVNLNDTVSCVHKNHHKELITALFESLIWVIENIK